MTSGSGAGFSAGTGAVSGAAACGTEVNLWLLSTSRKRGRALFTGLTTVVGAAMPHIQQRVNLCRTRQAFAKALGHRLDGHFAVVLLPRTGLFRGGLNHPG